MLITVKWYKLECERCNSIMLGCDGESPTELREKAKENGWTRPKVKVFDQFAIQDRCKECTEEADTKQAES